MLAKRLNITRSVLRISEAVQDQRNLTQAEAEVELPCQRNYFDVKVRIVDPKHLYADLVELSVSATLGLLLAEVGSRIPDLPRRNRSMLRKGTTHARCQLRS